LSETWRGLFVPKKKLTIQAFAEAEEFFCVIDFALWEMKRRVADF
jgi:hypothetical protein